MNTNNKWPKQIPILKAEDFEHGAWEDAAENGPWCGTRRCMVGWVGSVFHGTAHIVDRIHIMEEPCREFLLKISELAGYPAKDGFGIYDNHDLAHHVSDIFEGVGFPFMSEKDAAKLWLKTIKSFGYTEIFNVE